MRYKAFGTTRFTSGTTPTSVRFTGQREEASLGLYDYGERWYDPALGHFLSPDTIYRIISQSLNLQSQLSTTNTPLQMHPPPA